MIEAKDETDAISRAESIGLYWDGVSKGIDCGCCGDRWSTPWDDKGKSEPMIYDTPVAQATSIMGGWMKPGREIAVHYLDGKVKWYGVGK